MYHAGYVKNEQRITIFIAGAKDCLPPYLTGYLGQFDGEFREENRQRLESNAKVFFPQKEFNFIYNL